MAKPDKPIETAPDATTQAFHLVVVHPFADYQRGDRITDPAIVAQIVVSETAHHCNRIGIA